MPEISRFFGMVITMYSNDHAPPHFHVRYGDDDATIDIASLAILRGRLSPRVRALVTEWAALHQHELVINWQRIQRDELPLRIAPLE